MHVCVYNMGAGTSLTTRNPEYFQRRNDTYGNIYNKVVEQREIVDKYFCLVLYRFPTK